MSLNTEPRSVSVTPAVGTARLTIVLPPGRLRPSWVTASENLFFLFSGICTTNFGNTGKRSTRRTWLIPSLSHDGRRGNRQYPGTRGEIPARVGIQFPT
eukprot:2692646-Rhodomonas_salina.1